MSETVDIMVYGATGVTGRRLARRLDEVAPPGLRLGLAGRRPAAVAAIAAELSRDVVVVEANSDDPASVEAMVRRSRVVASTAGPFVRYGTPVVAAAARFGVDYVDITGETPWVADMIQQFHETARETGARILPCCGFDSVPSDMGAFVAARTARERWSCGLTQDRVVVSMKGGLNGGTLASALALSELGVDRKVSDPFLLDPPREVDPGERRANFDPREPVFHETHGAWVAPFFMGPINTRVVRRSAALLAARGEGYGEGFRYQEYQSVGRGKGSRLRAWAVTLGLGAFFGLTTQPWGRALLRRWGPAPGEGPDEATIQGGFTQVVHHALAENGERFRVTLEAQGDPGNEVTVRLLAEAALTLALDREALPDADGVVTTAVGLGEAYARRLTAAGVGFVVS